MRRPFALCLSVLLLAALPTVRAYAQSQDQDDQRRTAQAAEDDKKKKKEKDWKIEEGPLPTVKNAGPCPFTRSLYDAARYVELKNGEESPSAVAYTGEIEHVDATCEYKGAEPIKVHLALGFAFGRGPQAAAAHKDYRYWVAVTIRNLAVLDKAYFTVPVDFAKGEDRVAYADHLPDIIIPRARAGVSGANFEVLVGFDVTPQMADFNRQGKRFRVDASGTKTASNAGTPAAQ